MTGEKVSSPDTQAPFQNGQQIGFPEQAGHIQLAEQYSTPDTHIQWEAHPYTRTDGWRETDRRRALINDAEGNTWYLRGPVLFDVSGSLDSGSIQGTQLDIFTKMPDLTIGQAAPFSKLKPITEVLIATGLSDSRPKGTKKHGYDAFEDIEEALRGLAGGTVDPSAIHSRIEDEIIGVRLQQRIHGQTFRYRDPRYLQITDATRKAKKPLEGDGPAVDPGVTNFSPEKAARDETVPLVLSRHGIPLSPRMDPDKRLNPTTGERYEYKTYLWRRAGKTAITGVGKGGKSVGRGTARGGRVVGRGTAKVGRKSAEAGVRVGKETGKLSAKAGKAAGRVAVKASLRAAAATSANYTKLRERGEDRFDSHEPTPLFKRIK